MKIMLSDGASSHFSMEDFTVGMYWFISLWKQFSKACNVCKVFKFAIPITSFSFWKIKRTYILPSIDEIWERHQNEILDEFQGKDLIILGILQEHSCIRKFSEFDSEILFKATFIYPTSLQDKEPNGSIRPQLKLWKTSFKDKEWFTKVLMKLIKN